MVFAERSFIRHSLQFKIWVEGDIRFLAVTIDECCPAKLFVPTVTSREPGAGFILHEAS